MLRAPAAGEHELAIGSEPAPSAELAQPAGVAVSDLELTVL
jgi:hypothetical protein